MLDAPHSMSGRVAVVTGASRGIGRAIALALSRVGTRLCIVGRDPIALAETAGLARQSADVKEFNIDLASIESLEPLVRYLEEDVGLLDVLVHSAGIIHQAPMRSASVADFDLQYAVNVRAPYALTQQVLPLLTTARGQVVFINSSAGLSANREEVGQYAATKHALKAVADSLRAEVNPAGVRVLSVYLGRTATPMQESLHRREGKIYHPETLLQPDDVASIVVQALQLPATAEVTDIFIRPAIKT